MYDNALEEFNLSYKYDNDCVDAIYNKGIVLISINKYQEALKALLNVNDINSNDIEVMLDITHCYYKTNDFETAIIWVSKVLTINPDHNSANKLLKKLLSLKQ